MYSRLASLSFCLMAGTVYCSPAQPIDSLRSVLLTDSAHNVFSTMGRFGFTSTATASLNEFLAAHGYGSTRFKEGRFATTAFGVSIRAVINRWVLEPEVTTILPSRSSDGRAEVSHSFWALQTNIGYQIPMLQMDAFRRLTMHPYVGLGARLNRLAIIEQPQTNFTAIFNDSSSNSYSFSNEMVYGEVGFELDYGIQIMENERSITRLVFGCRTGYTFGLSSDEWKQSGNELLISDGPDMKPSGPSAWMTIGWQIQPRVYDARIVAERNPDEKIPGH